MRKRAVLLSSLWLSTSFVCSAALLPPIMTPPGGLVRAPALVTLTNLKGIGTIFYTLDGGDPRDALGFVATNARVHYAPVANHAKYVPPLSVNQSMMVRARVKD